MKKILLSIAILAVTFFSCRKPLSGSAPESIDGKWRMVVVKDNGSGLEMTKPASIQGEVEITFTSAGLTKGIFSGNTPTNDIWQNDYSTGSNRTISIPSLSMTKVSETSWGSEFVDHIRDSRSYFFEMDGRLSIRTTKKSLTFKRL